MKYAGHEYIFHIAPPGSSSAIAFVDNTTSWVASMIIPQWNQTINRVSFFVYDVNTTNGFTGTAVAGIASVASNGTVDAFIGSGTTALSIPNAATRNATNNNSLKYYEVSFSDVAVTAGTPYYVALKLNVIGTGDITFAQQTVSPIYRWPLTQTGTNVLGLGQGHHMYGYNDGTTTQWYGTPGFQTQSAQLNASANSSTLGSTWVELGGLINLPYIAGEYRVRAVSVLGRLGNTAHTVTCKINKADGTTQVENASASVNGNEAAAGTQTNRIVFEFPGVATLYPGQEYRIAFTATGATGANTHIQTWKPFSYATLYDDTAEMSKYDNAWDVYNKFYTRLTSTSAIDKSYGYWSGWLAADLILDSLYSSNRRGAKGPINYQVPGEGLKLWLEAGQYQSYPQTGTSWYDLSGNGHHFSGTTSVTWSSDLGGMFIHPDENNRAWKNSNVAASWWNSNDFTVLCWNNINDTGTSKNYIFSTGTTESGGLGLYTVGSTDAYYVTVQGSTTAISASSAGGGNLELTALRYYNSTKLMTFWPVVDYVTNATSSSTYTLSSSLAISGTSLHIGGASWDESNTKYYGYIGNFIAFNRALTNDEIITIYYYTREKYGLTSWANGVY